MSSTQHVDDLTDSDASDSQLIPSPNTEVPVEPVIVGPTRPERPATWLAATLLLVLVFAVGVLVGQSGALGGLPGGASSGATNSPPSSGSPAATGDITASTTDCKTGAYSMGSPLEPAEAPADFDLFWQALACIRQNYVGRADLIDKDVTYGAINGMVEALGDTGHSTFLTPEALASEQQSLDGTVVGVGALLGTKDGQPVIVSVISGGPADEAGMKSGDVILSVDDTKVTNMNPGEVATKIRGAEGTQVVVVVLRPSTGETLTFTMTREKIDFPAASWAFVPGTKIADLRLIQFSSGAADELLEARDEAAAQGAAGFILDLRSNPGGFVPEAVNTASLFLKDKTVYIRELADGERIPVPTNNDYPASDLPMVVLIDQGTASSAEIVSGALKSAQRGDLVGETTFGTGTVLLTFNLNDGSAVRVAVERWLTPDGELIFAKGITPTVEVALPATATPLEPQQLAQIPPDQVATMQDSQMLKGIQLLQAAGVP
jgi:carboxyl-terminal processing protease